MNKEIIIIDNFKDLVSKLRNYNFAMYTYFPQEGIEKDDRFKIYRLENEDYALFSGNFEILKKLEKVFQNATIEEVPIGINDEYNHIYLGSTVKTRASAELNFGGVRDAEVHFSLPLKDEYSAIK